jgi:hypothetical protein
MRYSVTQRNGGVLTLLCACACGVAGFSGGQQDEPQARRSSQTGSSLSSITSSAKAMFGLDNTDSGYSGNRGAGDFNNPVSSSNVSSSGSVGSIPSHQDRNSGGAYNGNPSSMAGIGNPNFQDTRSSDQNSITSRVSAAASGILGKFSSTTSAPASGGNFNSKGGNSGSSGSSDDYQFRSNRPHNFGNNSQSTGVWGPNGSSGNLNNNTGTSSNNNSGGGNPNPIVPELPSASGGMGRAGAASSSGEYEQGLVEALCAPGGMKAVPQEDKLVAFLRTAPTLSSELVGNALLECMNADAWQSRVKALIVLCRLMNTANCEDHAVWWADNGEQDLLSLRSDGKASVRTQAGKALQLIGLEGEVAAVMERSQQRRKATGQAAGSAGRQHSGGRSGEVSLLDFDDSSTNNQSKPEVQASNSSDDGGLFSGLSLGDTRPTPQQQIKEQPKEQPREQPREEPPAPSVFDSNGGSLDILSFNDPLMNPPPVQHQVQQQQQPHPSSAISALDFMDGSEDDQLSRSRQSSVEGSSFDFMSGGKERTSSTDRSSLTGFDFMGGGAGSGGLTPQQYQQQQQHLFMQQQQQQFMHQQQYMMQQQQHMQHMPQQQHHMQQQNHMNQQQRQYQQQPMAGGGVMGGLGMGRKHIPEANQQGSMGGDSGFSFVSGGSPAASSRKVPDAFSFVSDTVASKKATTNFSNKLT